MNPTRMIRLFVISACVTMIAALAGCEPGPQPIAYGEDTCDRCVMGISDTRFGAQIVTRTGKVYKFDSVECLAGFALEMSESDIHSMWVTDFRRPEVLVKAPAAVYLAGSKLSSPMGLSLLAFSSEAESDSIRTAFGGELVEWPALLELVAANASPHSGHAHGPADDPNMAATDSRASPNE